MADSASNVIKMGNTLRLDELSNLTVVLRMLGGGRRRRVVENYGMHFRVEDMLSTHLVKDVGDRSRIIV
jgi:hypothetical protein